MSSSDAPCIKLVHPNRHKESQVVEERIDGVIVRGVWRNDDPAGHYKFQMYEDTGIKEATREVSGKGPFAKEALANTREAALSKLRAAQARRESIAMEASKMDVHDVMAMIGITSSSSGAAKAAAPDDEDSGGSDDQGEESQTSEDDDAGRFSDLFASVVPKAKAKVAAKVAAKPKKVVAAKVAGASVPAPTTSLQQPPEEARTEHAAPVSLAAELDGRFARLRAAVSQDIRDIKDSLLDTSFNDTFQVGSKEGWANLQKSVAARAKHLSGVLSKLRAAQSRITRSRNAEQLSVDKESLEQLLELTQQFAEFNMSET